MSVVGTPTWLRATPSNGKTVHARVSRSVLADAVTGWWNDTQANCVASGSPGAGGEITVSPRPFALLDATNYGQRLWWDSFLWAVNTSTGQGQWVPLTVDQSGWNSYVTYPDGNQRDGTVFDDGLVVIGGTTAPGVDLRPDVGVVPTGWRVQPVIGAYSASGVFMWHLVPIDSATGVQIADPNVCIF